jgi:hypothetical protein
VNSPSLKGDAPILTLQVGRSPCPEWSGGGGGDPPETRGGSCSSQAWAAGEAVSH